MSNKQIYHKSTHPTLTQFIYFNYSKINFNYAKSSVAFLYKLACNFNQFVRKWINFFLCIENKTTPINQRLSQNEQQQKKNTSKH